MKTFYGFKLCGAWILALTLCGCAAIMPEADSELNYFQQIKLRLAYASADRLLDKGRAIEAADQLWNLAPEFPQPTRQTIRIRAAAMLSDNQLMLRAYRYLKAIDEKPLSEKLLLKKRLLTAAFYKQSHQARKIIKALPRGLLDYGSQDEKVDALKLIAYAQFELNELADGIQTMLTLDDMLQGAEKEENVESLWLAVLNGDPDKLQFYLEHEQAEAVKPWIQLALLATPKEIDRERLLWEFKQWKKNYPQWPLPESAEQTLHARWNYLDFKPEKIVMLLPLSGNYVKVGRAVLAGFTYAHRHQSSTNNWSIATYNTDQEEDVYALYRRAVREQSADVVIGPILKHKVAALAEGGPLEVPVIALNYLHDSETRIPGEFFQFGLLPEDEARQLARRLWNDEHHSVVALSGDNAWGRRIYESFAKEYESLGGRIREVSHYNPEYVDYGNVIRPLFKLDESREKISELEWLLGDQISYKPGLRDDVGAAVLFANHKEAVLIYPQLKYHYVDRLPIYSTSHAYHPSLEKQGRRDLHGLIYCDIPFIVHQQAGALPGLKEVDSEYWRLYAMGVDAYTLAQAFRRMDVSGLNVDGLTGTLQMDANRRLFRALLWARLSVSGTPVLLNPAMP